MNRNLKTTLTVIALGALAAGGNVVYQRYDRNLQALSRASIDWPSVQGLVTHSALLLRNNKIGTGRKTDYVVDVAYEYVVGDKVYRNDIVRFDQGQMPGSRKERLVSAYPVGRRVEVFYDPDDPDQSVLLPGLRTD